MVKNALLQPQEIEVYYVIPALRRYLAIYMKEVGLSQHKIAELLYIEDSTVSQYISGKRGSKAEFGEEVLNEIKKSAGKIDDKLSLIRETQRLLKLVRGTGGLCKIHKQISDIPNDCEPISIGCTECEDDGRNAKVCY